MTATKQALAAEVAAAVDGQGRFDTDAITDALWVDGYRSLDGVPDQDFWRLAGRHETPEPDPFGDFRRELSAAIASQRVGRDAIWTDGVVTVRARGVSRVNQELPQPTGQFTVETALDTARLGAGATWDGLWDAVAEAREAAESAASSARERVRSASARHRHAEQAAREALHTRNEAILAARASGMTYQEIADAAGISLPLAHKVAAGG